jgi:diguanylate cyclase (GGDEF)-like protein
MTSPYRDIQLFSLLSPTIALIFAMALFIAWRQLRQHRYILILSLSFTAFAAGALSQILAIPRDVGLNTLASALLYTAAALGIIEACLARLGRGHGLRVTIPIAIGILVLIAYYFYADRNLLARVYVLNFGYGVLFLGGAAMMGIPRRGRPTDFILFLAILVFGVQFFLRTLATIDGSVNGLDSRGFSATTFWIALNFSLILFGVILGLTFLTAIVGDVIRSLNAASETDPLTGAVNRRGFDRLAEAMLIDVRQHPVGLIVCDIDRFKQINDTHGHPFGDTVLSGFGALLRDNARPADVVARLGGEEFAIILPNSDLDAAHAFADRLRQRIESAGSGGITVTASFGVAQASPGEDLADLLERADGRLYAAKRGGRNRTVSGRDEAAPPEREPARAR